MNDETKKPAPLEPGTPEHEEAVKSVLSKQAEVLKALQELDIVESRQLEIGNNFIAFRFRR